ncbi:MAG: UDP-glucose 4-epimerase GalE [Cyclobacteriaceae bacterium]
MGRVLVTGGLGFIGSHTSVELLQLGQDIVIADNLSNSTMEVLDGIKKITSKTLEFVKVDFTDLDQARELFRSFDIEAIIHFAASKAVGESVEKPLLYYRNNLDSLINLLDLSQEFDVKKFVFSSSCTVYGEPDQLPVSESTPVKQAESPYGNTKQIGEEIISDFVKSQSQTKAISLRYFNPIGAHDSSLIGELPLGVPANLVPYITQTAAGIRESLSVYGGDYETLDGTCVRDYIHVVDLAKAHIQALNYCGRMQGSYDFFNVGTGSGSTVLQVIKSFEKVSGLQVNYEIVDRRPGDIEKTYADTSKANNVLNWKAERDLDNMMKTAWEWQKSLQKD